MIDIKKFARFLISKLLLLGLLCAALSVNAQDPSCKVVNSAFNIGERITYKIQYHWYALWFGAGEVSFTVDEKMLDDKKCYHFKGVGNTYDSYDWFYKVRDTYESYADQETMQPLKFVRDVYEGGYTIYNNVTFDHENHIARGTKKDVEIPLCIQDVLSAIYFARNIDFSPYKPQDTIPMDMYLDNQVYNIYIRYLGKEKVKTKLGTFNTIVFRPLLIEGTIFKGGEKMKVWVTDDENKIPIRVSSPIVVGEIVADLISFENVRNEFTSKIKD